MDSLGRQEYIRAAVSFLQDPKLIDSNLQDKLKFLKDKGLSQNEVDEALNLALINRRQSQDGKWNFLLVLGLCVGSYKLYQAFVSSAEPKQIPVPQEQEKMSFADILQKLTELKRIMEQQKNELQSVKTLILGHEKFAAPPVIPPWQMKDAEER